MDELEDDFLMMGHPPSDMPWGEVWLVQALSALFFAILGGACIVVCYLVAFLIKVGAP